jgi:hypothetical protein
MDKAHLHIVSYMHVQAGFMTYANHANAPKEHDEREENGRAHPLKEDVGEWFEKSITDEE